MCARARAREIKSANFDELQQSKPELEEEMIMTWKLGNIQQHSMLLNNCGT